MALPTDSSNTFLREVDENLRRDRARDIARQYGKWIVLGVVLFLAAIAGWLYWQERQRQQAAAESEQLAEIYRDIGTRQAKGTAPRLDALAGKGTDVTRASALFAAAAVALEQNDRRTAVEKFRAVREDGDLPQPYRDLALVRMTAIEFDQLKPEEVIARMEPLAKAGEPMFGSAAELTAMALLRQNKKAEAGRLFAAIAFDRGVPDTLRARSVQLAGSLGVDASAAMPSISQSMGAQ
ncbi:MAG TPA: tetratricopeptide repeat protein [Sphingomicrobium sp.]|nr:tetratricopeptide repeat protein [Sphingomicrobium sp.]